MSEEADKPKDVALVVKCLVKGYHACHFTVEVGEEFVTNQRGQLGHLQAELVSPLWPLKAEINV